MVPEEKTRVDFNAPSSLVAQADVIAELLDTSRTQLLIEALRDEITDLITDEDFKRRVNQAYFSGQIDIEVLESVLGPEEASQMRLLHESVGRDPPEPRTDIEPLAVVGITDSLFRFTSGRSHRSSGGDAPLGRSLVAAADAAFTDLVGDVSVDFTR